MKAVLAHKDDIEKLVNHFYARVREDEFLAPIFNNVIQDRWPQHLEKMYNFWETVLLDKHTYYGNPFLPHSNLPISENHFHRWLDLFYQTLDNEFEGEKAEETKQRANKMAEMFQMKIDFHRKNKTKPLV